MTDNSDIINRIAKERADWLVDAVATATQDRTLIRGEPDENEVLTEAILLNGEKAIQVALARYAEATK
jgi:hypothetical protein